MVTFINGSLGVGKSTVSQYLLWSHPKTVLLDGDALCNINPFDAYDRDRIRAVTDIFCYMVEKYQSIGFCRFVVDSIFEKTSEIEEINRRLGKIDPDIAHYLLIASDEKRKENIERRNRENYLWELERSAELQGLLLTEFGGSELIKTIDTTPLDVRQVGELILRERGNAN